MSNRERNGLITGLLPLFIVVCLSCSVVGGLVLAVAAREGTGPGELVANLLGGRQSTRPVALPGEVLLPTYTPELLPVPTTVLAEVAPVDQAPAEATPAPQATEPSVSNVPSDQPSSPLQVVPASQPQAQAVSQSPIYPGSGFPERPATRLVIPAMNLDTAVTLSPIENQTWKVDHLGTDYVGHLEGTASPGDSSNMVLAGHVTVAASVYGPFAGLGQLQAGDPIVVYSGDQAYTYIVDYSKLVERTAVDVAYPTDVGRVTLITCSNWSDELGVYQERLIVVGHLVDGGS